MTMLCSLPQGCGEKAEPDFICRITAVEGTVQVQRTGTAQPAVAEKGLKLGAGDRVITDASSSVRLQFQDFATVVLGEKTLYVVTSHKAADGKGLVETSTELLKGVGLVKVDKTKGQGFEIKTPHVITGVLGTEFGLLVTEGEDDSQGDEGKGQTMLAVLEGLVSFSGCGEVLQVKGGWGARCNGFTPPGLIKKFGDLDGRLTEALQGFVKEETKGSGNLKTIFRQY